MSNVLPLTSGEGLDSSLRLRVWDALPLKEHSTLKWDLHVDPTAIDKNGNVSPIKVTLCWYDPPSAVAMVSSLLLHDLDLLVVGPDKTAYWGNGMTGGDESNPNEQVTIRSPKCLGASCTYTVYVHAHALPFGGSQHLALVITSAGMNNNFKIVLACRAQIYDADVVQDS